MEKISITKKASCQPQQISVKIFLVSTLKMQRTPPANPTATQQTINVQSAKRNRNELSPNIETERAVTPTGLSQIELIELISSTINSNLDEKLKTLSTKEDIEEVKVEINSISSEINQLRTENQKLKEELRYVRRECEENKKDLMWMHEHIKSNKIFIRGLNSSSEPVNEVNNILTNKLELKVMARSVRKIHERNGRMTVVTEFTSSQESEDVIRNGRKLAGSNIYIERDLIPSKQQLKKISLCLKSKIMKISKEHNITVREDKIKIKNIWFTWNKDRKLVAGKNDAKDELHKIYGDIIETLDTNYEYLLCETQSKN